MPRLIYKCGPLFDSNVGSGERRLYMWGRVIRYKCVAGAAWSLLLFSSTFRCLENLEDQKNCF